MHTQALLDFLQASTSPFHAVAAATERLQQAGFLPLSESEAWSLKPGQGYWVVREGALIAFRLGEDLSGEGLRLIGAHTDSPGLKLKPHPDQDRKGHWTLSIETYGGALLATWLDRELSVAGKVAYRNGNGVLKTALIDFKRPLGLIPSLAIHLRPKANEGWKIDAQKELPPVLQLPGEPGDFRELVKAELGSDVAEVLDFDLYLYPTQAPALVGVKQEMIAAARLDNLFSCFCALEALCSEAPGPTAMVVFNDHEEVGSGTAPGAAGNFLESVIERLAPEPEERARMVANSWFLSGDNAHAVHPNHADKHDEAHAPVMGGGPVIKVNANQSYITDAQSAARFADLCGKAQVPVQRFAVRADLRCGSTIGPLTARRLGFKGLDVGAPTWAMHSARETAAVKDLEFMIQAMTAWIAN